MTTTSAALTVKMIERQDGKCVLYFRMYGGKKRRQRCADRAAALLYIQAELDLASDQRAAREITGMPAAKIETERSVQ